MANKFWSLTLVKDQNKHSVDIIDDIQQSLRTIYQGHKFYNLFGADAINYVCGLATRYAYHTSRWSQEYRESSLSSVILQGLHGYSLWLSIVWLIDGLCDKYRTLFTQDDLQVLTNIMLGKFYNITSTAPVVLLLFNIVQRTYSRYTELLTNNNRQELDDWTVKYFNTLLDDDKRSFTLSQYASWRLDSGAMMCVVWHELLMSPEYRKEDIDDNTLRAFELVSLIVSYHNDLVSLHRDIEQGTPNLVTTINKDDCWKGVIEAVVLTNNMYEELLELLANIKYSYLSAICTSIVHGSIIWTSSEKRYSKGLSMLELVAHERRDEFMKLLYEKTAVAGDPKL